MCLQITGIPARHNGRLQPKPNQVYESVTNTSPVAPATGVLKITKESEGRGASAYTSFLNIRTETEKKNPKAAMYFYDLYYMLSLKHISEPTRRS